MTDVTRATVEIGTGTDGHRAIAYASFAGEPVVRLPLHVSVRPALRGRDVGYAAVTAVAQAALERGLRRATFRLDDRALVADLREHRAVPSALSVPYVMLRCLLNRFEAVDVDASVTHVTRDLSARARADVALAVAA